MIDGAVEKAFVRIAGEATEGTVIKMPPSEPHVDVFGRTGARLIVAETRDDEDIVLQRDWSALLIAWRIARELEHPDAFTRLAVEGLVLELTASTGRISCSDAPRWLEGAREIILDRPFKTLTVTAIADEIGVDPRVLARSFRRHFGASMGQYVRNARLDWAAAQLVNGDVPLATLALEAGFADQSHFTRSFKRRMGLPPGRYRRAHR